MKNWQKMRGVIDPFTLGLLISLVGGMTAYLTYQGDTPPTAQSDVEGQLTSELVVITSDESSAVEENPE